MGVLDKIDLAVLREVAVNGRITVTDLAYRVGLSKRPAPFGCDGLKKANISLAIAPFCIRKKWVPAISHSFR